MSHHNYPNQGRFRQSPTGGDSHRGSSYSRQMDLPDRHRTNDFPAEAPSHDPFYHSIPQQPYNHALQNAWVHQVPPAPGHGEPELEGHREDIYLPVGVGGVAGPGRVQDPHRINMAYRDYHPQPFADPTYIFPDVGHAQGIQAQAQPNALVNQERDLIGHVPQHVVPDPPQAAFPHPFFPGIPTPNQPRPEDLRQLASRYWYHPDAQVGMVSVEAGTTGQYEVVITLKTPIGF